MIDKVLPRLLALAGLTLGGFYAWGLSFPAKTWVERNARFVATPEQVYARISNIGDQKTWRSDIGKVDVSADGTRWTEVSDNGSTLAFHLIESRPGATFAIAYQSSLGFEGRWRVELAPSDEGTRCRFNEEVTTTNPFMRAIGRLASPPGQHLDLYISDLQRVLGS